MNFKLNESIQKLTGSYYTPKWLADYICSWALDTDTKRILEPSCGDGVFFESLIEQSNNTLKINGFDIDPEATQICTEKLAQSNFEYDIENRDFIKWALENVTSLVPQKFDAVIGNPPFIRYQYLDKELQDASEQIFSYLNVSFSKHANAWMPFVLAAVALLNNGGRLGMIVPSEILHILYASGLRKYLLEKCSRILIIDPEELWFERTLQGAVIILAEKKKGIEASQGVAILRTNGKNFTKEDPSVLFDTADYVSGADLKNKWTFALLSSEERMAYEKICHSKYINQFSQLATVDVGIVTGANNYFLITDSVVEKYNLNDVVHPMFGRSEHCPGIIYDFKQHEENSAKAFPTNFVYLKNDTDEIKYNDYVSLGIANGLPTRYKCRIRKPWYTVPSVYSSPICMLKRSNGMPRLILNQIGAYNTDTAYRIAPYEGVDSTTLVCCFLNSLTALSAELEGRYYGGGVLELVPSEIERLRVPYIDKQFVDIKELNQQVKEKSTLEILLRQDEKLFPLLDVAYDDVKIIQGALKKLQLRRQRKKDSEGE